MGSETYVLTFRIDLSRRLVTLGERECEWKRFGAELWWMTKRGDRSGVDSEGRVNAEGSGSKPRRRRRRGGRKCLNAGYQ